MPWLRWWQKPVKPHCLPAPLWADFNKADGAKYHPQQAGSTRHSRLPGNASPKIYMLYWAEVPISNQAKGMAHVAKWHLCHNSRTAMGWTAALQFQYTPAREQQELPLYWATQKSSQFVFSHALTIFSPRISFCWSTTQSFIKGFLDIYKKATEPMIGLELYFTCSATTTLPSSQTKLAILLFTWWRWTTRNHSLLTFTISDGFYRLLLYFTLAILFQSLRNAGFLENSSQKKNPYLWFNSALSLFPVLLVCSRARR